MLYYPVYALYRYYPETFWVRAALTLCLLCCGIVLIVLLYKKGRIGRRGRNAAILWWIYTIFLLYITVLGRYSSDEYKIRAALFESYRQVFTEGDLRELRAIILNILIFVPFGALSAELIKNRFPIWTVFVAGFSLSLAIELLQLVTRTGTFETDDLIHNTLGAALGVLLWYAGRALIGKLRKSNNTNIN